MRELIRASTPQQRRSLKAAARLLVSAAGGGESCRHVTRVGPPALSRYQSIEDADSHMPADVVLDLELDCGVPAVTEFLARAQGFRLVSARRAEGGGPGAGDVINVMREASELAAELSAALSDGEITRSEALKIKRELNDLLKVLHDLAARMPGECGR